MEEKIRKAYDEARNFENKKIRSGCYAPFVSLYFTTLGNVLACCKNQTFVLGNVKSQRLTEIWNGNKTMLLRKALADYRFESGCELCEWQIASGDFHSGFPALFEEFTLESMTPQWPAMIEFAGSNTCNFECLMCAGELSSSIRTHRDGLPPLPRFYGDEFFQDLSEFLPHLKRAKFLGGEPFLASECLQIWDMILDMNLVIPCHVTTNASQRNQRVERILKELPISLTVSLDGITKKTYEGIRINSNFDETIQNLKYFREYTKQKGTYFSLAFCLMRQNYHEFSDVLSFAEELDCDVFVNTVVSPVRCSLYALPPSEILRIANEMENEFVLKNVQLQRNAPVWKEQLERLKANATSEEIASIRDSYAVGLSQQYLRKAWKLAEQKMFAEALQEAKKAHPENSYFGLAYCADIKRMAGQYTEAEDDFNRAINISAKRPEAFIFRGKLRVEQKRFDEAFQDAQKARALLLEGDPFEKDIHEILNRVHANEENFALRQDSIEFRNHR